MGQDKMIGRMKEIKENVDYGSWEQIWELEKEETGKVTERQGSIEKQEDNQWRITEHTVCNDSGSFWGSGKEMIGKGPLDEVAWNLLVILDAYWGKKEQSSESLLCSASRPYVTPPPQGSAPLTCRSTFQVDSEGNDSILDLY